MMSLVGRPDVAPRLRVDFSMRDLIASLGGTTDGGAPWPAAGREPCLVSSGRAGLWLLLKGLDLKPGSRVGVPLFVCEAVFEAIARAGCEPVFLDVDPDTMVLSPDTVPAEARVDAVVAVHLFGNPVDVPALGRELRIPVIEDCAHALFSEIGGRPVGALGSGALYSFGLGKPVSIGRLGAAVANDLELDSRLREVASGMPQESRPSALTRGLRSCVISALYRRPWYGLFSFELGRMMEASLDPMGHASPEYAVARDHLAGLVRAKVAAYREGIPRQRRLWRNLADAVLDGSAGRIAPQSFIKGAVSDSFLLAMRCESRGQRERFIGSLLKHGLDSIPFYDSVPAIARERYGYSGGAPVAEELCQAVVVVPVPTEADDGRASAIETALGASAGESR